MFTKSLALIFILQLTYLPSASSSVLSACFSRLLGGQSNIAPVLKGASGEKYQTIPMKDKYVKWDADRSITYLNEEQRSSREIFINREGQLVRRNGEVLKAEKGETLIFVMDENGRIFADTFTRFEFHHSSFLAGNPVAAAGQLEMNSAGFLKEVTGQSGHYHPKGEQLEQLIDELKNRGANLDFWNESVRFRKESGLPVFFTY